MGREANYLPEGKYQTFEDRVAPLPKRVRKYRQGYRAFTHVKDIEEMRKWARENPISLKPKERNK